MRGRHPGLAHTLLAQGVTAEPLTRTIAALNDALARRAIEQMLARHELDGSDWCWLALGSEGRSEQTFASDQDNALVFAVEAGVDAWRTRLLAFAHDVNQAFATLGFPLCEGGVMARNPEYCMTVTEWKDRFHGLAYRADSACAAGREHRVRFPSRCSVPQLSRTTCGPGSSVIHAETRYSCD